MCVYPTERYLMAEWHNIFSTLCSTRKRNSILYYVMSCIPYNHTMYVYIPYAVCMPYSHTSSFSFPWKIVIISSHTTTVYTYVQYIKMS